MTAPVANGVAAVVEPHLRAQQVVDAAALVHDLAVAAAAFPNRLDALHHRIARLDVEDRGAGDVATHHHHPRREEGAADELSLAGALAVDERRADAHREDDAGGKVDDAGALHELGAAEFVALDLGGHHSAVGLRDDVGAGPAGVAAMAAEAGVLRPDQILAVAAQRLVVHAEAGRRTVAHVRDDDVEGRDEALDQALSVLVLEVDGDAALPSIERVERLVLPGDRAAPPPRGSAVERLDLHDIRAEVGERDAAEGSRDDLREFEHANAVEWSAHDGPPACPARWRRPHWGPDGSSPGSGPGPGPGRGAVGRERPATRICPRAGA